VTAIGIGGGVVVVMDGVVGNSCSEPDSHSSTLLEQLVDESSNNNDTHPSEATEAASSTSTTTSTPDTSLRSLEGWEEVDITDEANPWGVSDTSLKKKIFLERQKLKSRQCMPIFCITARYHDDIDVDICVVLALGSLTTTTTTTTRSQQIHLEMGLEDGQGSIRWRSASDTIDGGLQWSFVLHQLHLPR
jgi:hypothetical protein